MVEDPVGRQRWTFRRERGERGEVLHMEGWVDPGGDAPPHVHPSHEERFEVLEGEMQFTAGRKKRRARPGDKLVVPAGMRHAFRNPGKTTARVRVEVEPPSELQAMIEDFAALGREGHMMRLGRLMLPKGPTGALRAAVLIRHYRPTTVVLMPPVFVQRLLLDPLARLGERRGYRPGLG